MSKKKRSKKKRPNARKATQGGKKEPQKKKAPPPEPQTLAKVLTRLTVFLLISAGIFYVTVHHVIGGVALWKVWVLASLPLIQLTMRRMSFDAPGIAALFTPNGAKLGIGLGAFIGGNALCFALFQFVVQGKPAAATATKLGSAAIFVVSPIFAFLIKAKAATWASFTALNSTTQISAVLASLLFYYGAAVLFHLEKDHLPVDRAPIEMMAV